MRQHALPGLAPAEDTAALRRAWGRVPGRRGVAFEQALALPYLRRCLEIMAEREDARRRERSSR